MFMATVRTNSETKMKKTVFDLAKAIVYRDVRHTGRFSLSPAVLAMVNEKLDRELDQMREQIAARERRDSRQASANASAFFLSISEWATQSQKMRIPMMSISHSDLMPIRSERSDAGLSQFEVVIGISQYFCLFSLS
jgi:hypothetical protein